MSEIKVKVQPFKRKYVCDKCGEGEMKSTGERLLTAPPLWLHRCTNKNCDAILKSHTRYPVIDYEEIEN